MQVSEKLINKWNDLKDHKDVTIISKKVKRSKTTISLILSGKQETTIDVIEKIDAYFNERKKRIEKLENGIN